MDDGSGADFRSIQEAVNNSVPGDTITVMPGIYTENVLVNITGLTIKSESNNGDAQVKPVTTPITEVTGIYQNSGEIVIPIS
ncbi:hypothetical protein DU58_02350 [Methanosarcina mazei]|uniref:Cell surface protein n=1 Tax=Methanosarcina mazei TaxID=2209 RepID=A0A0F8NWE1_METMZ|nr:hypothetical protein DU58_02350 [Methanosarcina mazei]